MIGGVIVLCTMAACCILIGGALALRGLIVMIRYRKWEKKKEKAANRWQDALWYEDYIKAYSGIGGFEK